MIFRVSFSYLQHEIELRSDFNAYGAPFSPPKFTNIVLCRILGASGGHIGSVFRASWNAFPVLDGGFFAGRLAMWDASPRDAEVVGA